MGIAARVKVTTTPFDVPLGLADQQVDAAAQTLETERNLNAAIVVRHCYGFA